MLQTLKLLLPALIPSWRFFDAIAPSPRIEFTLLNSARDMSGNWQEFRPRPDRLSIFDMLKRMFWNADWNESLFLVSCAERLIANPTAHSSDEILTRIRAECARLSVDPLATPYLQFRLVFVTRDETAIEKHILHISPVHRYLGGAGL